MNKKHKTTEYVQLFETLRKYLNDNDIHADSSLSNKDFVKKAFRTIARNNNYVTDNQLEVLQDIAGKYMSFVELNERINPEKRQYISDVLEETGEAAKEYSVKPAKRGVITRRRNMVERGVRLWGGYVDQAKDVVSDLLMKHNTLRLRGLEARLESIQAVLGKWNK
jgi:hypothetical protein|tara:strand:+ start:3218 stop:3715 length:498 start_codon:yes stop_codon:yes gene_type:complete